jgi:hypothetical protein
VIAKSSVAPSVLVAIVVALLTSVVLWRLSQMVSVTGPDGLRYDGLTFSRWPQDVRDTTRLENAIASWAAAQRPGWSFRALLKAQVLVDALVFTPAYCVAVMLLFGTWAPKWATLGIFLGGLLLLADESENVATYISVAQLSARPAVLQAVQWLTMTKWVLIGTTIALLISCVVASRVDR